VVRWVPRDERRQAVIDINAPTNEEKAMLTEEINAAISGLPESSPLRSILNDMNVYTWYGMRRIKARLVVEMLP
jgi:hypothetical protein